MTYILILTWWPLGGPRRVGELLRAAGRLSGNVSPFRVEQGTSLETPSRARAPGKSGLHARGEGGKQYLLGLYDTAGQVSVLA